MGNCCCGSIPTESCGWPRGTVRAMMAVIGVILGFAVTGAAELIFIFKEEYVHALAVQNIITAVIASIIAFYFGTKNGQSAGQAVAEANERIIAEKDREMELLLHEKDREIDMALDGTRGVRRSVRAEKGWTKRKSVSRRKSGGKKKKQEIVLPVEELVDENGDTVIEITKMSSDEEGDGVMDM